MSSENAATNQAIYDQAELECDLILKGGVASGVVYPNLILELARKYKFRQIGGTSVGAMAAAVAAASELNRAGGGFGTLERIPAFLQENMESLFQPSPGLKSLFNGIKVAQAGGWRRIVIGVGAWFLTPVILAYNLIFHKKLIGSVPKKLEENGYGICSGLKMPGHSGPGLTDWLAEQIEIAAGRMEPEGDLPARPLLFSDLWDGKVLSDEQIEAIWNDGRMKPEELSHEEKMDDTATTKMKIDLRMVTTNLSLSRPHELPFLSRNHYFEPAEMANLMPAWVADWMVENSSQAKNHPTLRYLPVAERMPVVLAARMSLSFPFLLSATPLYQASYDKGEVSEYRKVWFSDGGISSNMPIHMFDNWLPSRPTFAVSLDDCEPGTEQRVWLPTAPGQGRTAPHQSIGGTLQFASSILGAAKDWQDQLQMLSTGYKERVVHVALDSSEGGLNLDMSPTVMKRLGKYGTQAGQRLTGNIPSGTNHDTFDFEDHQWRRFLVLYERLEEDLADLSIAWDKTKSDGRTFGQLVDALAAKPPSHKKGSTVDRKKAVARMDELVRLAAKWSANNGAIRDKIGTPRPSPVMRIVSSLRQ
jgi:hypothetical protein